jgi:HPt (histidine-containing phosphotransfer) domain-containing protein
MSSKSPQIPGLLQQNNILDQKYVYLCVPEAIQRVCDEELVHEMLLMLNGSIENDWSEFEKHLNKHEYTVAANILHGMKGTIPIFSDKKTEDAIQQTEVLLRQNEINATVVKNSVESLRFQMTGFIAELKRWVESLN